MKAKLTEQQVFQLAANAINASVPMGLGFLHAKPEDYTASMIEESTNLERFVDYGVNFDYYDGRMVKLQIRRVAEGEYDIQPDEPRSDYQSWATKYPTSQDLINSVIEESPNG